MDVSTLLADPSAISLEAFVSVQNLIMVRVRAVQKAVCCPLCNEYSSSLHSNYIRQVADLLWHGVAIRLEMHTRKFRCRNELCQRKVFCERLPKVATAYARQTVRLNEAMTLLAFALGGEAGARTAADLGLTVSGDTLLRRIRSGSLKTPEILETPRVLGVDDFSFRRGINFGTILVDLEQRKPIDLLPDREAETLKVWLDAHPGVEIISRDRSGSYADGAGRGAPNAVQIADRFHLLQNLTKLMERFVNRFQNLLVSAALTVNKEQTPSAISIDKKCLTSVLSSLSEKTSQAKRERRFERYQKVIRLHREGLIHRQIAAQTGLSRSTVLTYLKTDAFPERQRHSTNGSILESFVPYLHQRWSEGCHNAQQLWREIKEQGYPGANRMVIRYIARLRVSGDEIPQTPGIDSADNKMAVFKTPSTKRAAWWLLQSPEDLKPEQRTFLERFIDLCPEALKIQEMGRRFRAMIRERLEPNFDEWMEAGQESGIKELENFIKGIKQDRAAVKASLTYEWSQGQVEGQINRLKMIKRQMYGRAKFDLLRARVLHRV